MKTLLSFSAGKDSAACLYMLRENWHEIDVVWCNPGDPYPETVEYMNSIREMVPRFIEVKSDSRGWIKQHGHPVDFLPAHRALQRSMQSVWTCCGKNLWEPMHRFVHENGYKRVIRGQKASDSLKSPVMSGQVIDGVEYVFPLESWTDDDVLSYLGPRLPPSYARRKTSLDCMRCTAYIADNDVADLEKIDKEAAEEVKSVYSMLRSDMVSALDALNG